jgi:hypothetical protein
VLSCPVSISSRVHHFGPETARLLRHANPQVTATVYAGLTDDQVKELGAKLRAAVSK